MNLIDKDALVAEIERLVNNYDKALDYEAALEDVRNFLDTLEVKEVDENEYINKYFKGWYVDLTDQGNILHTPDGNAGIMSAKEVARHFFELGMRVNNPITAADRGMVEEIIINLKRVEQDYHINLTREMEWLRNKVKKGK